MNKKFLVLFREPDGRTAVHTEAEKQRHQQRWKSWTQDCIAAGRLSGGSGLTLNGRLLIQSGEIKNEIYKNGNEIVGGFLLITAESLDSAAAIVASCPVFEFGGTAEIREHQIQ